MANPSYFISPVHTLVLTSCLKNIIKARTDPFWLSFCTRKEVFLKPRLSLSKFLRLVVSNSFNCLSSVKRLNINTNFSLLKNRTKCIRVFYFHIRGVCYQRTCNISREGLGQFHISKNVLRVHLQSVGYKVHSTWSFPSKSDVSITVPIYESNCIMTPRSSCNNLSKY